MVAVTQGKSVGGKRKLDVVAVYLESDVKSMLTQWAEDEGYRSVSSLSAHLLKQATLQRQKKLSAEDEVFKN